jgi:protein gp37
MADSLPWPQNVWMGVSVENQEQAWRVAELRKVPAAVRFVSAEPLLGPLNLDLSDIDWVIVGGESGPNHRPIKAEWVERLRDQCLDSDVAFFFKQWGGIRAKQGGDSLTDAHGMPSRRASRLRWCPSPLRLARPAA